MNIISNKKTIARNSMATKISQYAFWIVLGFGFLITIGTPVSLLNLFLSTALFIASLVFSLINSRLNSLWGVSPRPDEQLMAALKGLSNEYHFYDYSTSLPLLMIGPSGIYIFKTIDAVGIIYFDDKSLKWKTKKQGGFLQHLLSSNRLGNLRKAKQIMEIKWEKFKFEYSLPEDPAKPNFIIILNNEKSDIEKSDPEVELIRIDKVKDLIRKRNPLPFNEKEKIRKLIDILPN
jgi:hypothetical protein